MAWIYSVTLKNTFQKKPSQPMNGVPQSESDSITKFYYLVMLCMYIKFETLYTSDLLIKVMHV